MEIFHFNVRTNSKHVIPTVSNPCFLSPFLAPKQTSPLIPIVSSFETKEYNKKRLNKVLTEMEPTVLKNTHTFTMYIVFFPLVHEIDLNSLLLLYHLHSCSFFLLCLFCIIQLYDHLYFIIFFPFSFF